MKDGAEHFLLSTPRPVANGGVITEMEEPTEGCEGMVVVFDKVRIYVDMTKFNESICRLQIIRNTFYQKYLERSCFRSLMPIQVSGRYWQRTITPFCIYCFCCLPPQLQKTFKVDLSLVDDVLVF